MEIRIMPHSTKIFPTLDAFLNYLKVELPTQNNWIYRNKQVREPGKFILAYDKHLIGEFITTGREQKNPTENFGYNCIYFVKQDSVVIYEKPVEFQNFRQKVNLNAVSPNRAPGIKSQQYEVLRELAMQEETRNFNWVPTYEILGKELLKYRENQSDLLDILKTAENAGLPTINLKDKDTEQTEENLEVIDPFTFFANLNRGITLENWKKILKIVITQMDLSISVPSSFKGIPMINPQKSWFFPFKYERNEGDIDALWDLFYQAVEEPIKLSNETFRRVLDIKQVGPIKATMGLFWINPKNFLPLDRNTVNFLQKKANLNIKTDNITLDEYINLIETVKDIFPEKNFVQISASAYENRTMTSLQDEPKKPKMLEFSINSYEQEFINKIKDILLIKKQIILFGPPGTGKTHLALGLAQTIGKKSNNVQIVQFHPSYGYEDFIEGIKVETASDGRGISYTVIPKIFRTVCQQAQDNPDEYVVLIIDEINRGDLGRIFGELILGLEYRDKPINTLYMDTPLVIPKNLLLIGTMNSVDRSIAIVDFALRRRFQFIKCMPEKYILSYWLTQNNLNDPLKTRILSLFEKMNNEIRKEENKLGEHYQIGHVFFFVKKEEEMQMNWKFQIRPLLEEYLNFNVVSMKDFDQIFEEF